MSDIQKRFERIGVAVPEILLPSGAVELEKWSVVACDQYTSQPDYWSRVEQFVGGSPSTLHITFPEIYLEDKDSSERIERINKAMEDYINEKVLLPEGPCLVYVERDTGHSPMRKGLVLSVDLEKYDYGKGSQTLIRATEGTVLERIPPRVKIREKALLETPHVMLLVDDPGRTVVEPVAEKKYMLEKLYDFELMMGGGHIRGFRVDDETLLESICRSLEALSDRNSFISKYGVDENKGVLLFAVGDGNHSLASAKAHWENVKKTLEVSELQNHPARFALVEVVNVHDDGLVFEPIHRVVFNIDCRKVIEDFKDFLDSSGSAMRHMECAGMSDLKRRADAVRKNCGNHVLPYVSGAEYGLIIIENPAFNLETATLQSFLDFLAAKRPYIKVDYIHGEDVVQSLGSMENNTGFLLPAMNKHDLFRTVILDGALPRKTFSMGEAFEKRFYLECRRIVR